MRSLPGVVVVGMLFLSCNGRELPTSPKLASAAASAGAPGVPPPASLRIESVTPESGLPRGGETVRITGAGFSAPVRVLFESEGKQIETFVVSVQPFSIDVITPSVLLDNRQRLPADLHVIANAGTEREMRAVRKNAFVFQNAMLAPVVEAVSPNHSPVAGGARLQILGEGFQAPVQVLFEQDGHESEARIISVDFSRIVLDAPAGRRTGAADLIVRNIHSQTVVRFANAIQYTSMMRIASISPSSAPATGGALVTISGEGFTAPAIVTIGGVPATVLRVRGTEILVRTGAAQCSDDGPVTVLSPVTGETATGPIFEYRCPRRRAA